jgi:hypothetical protein
VNGYVTKTAARILAALKAGQKHKRGICQALDTEYQNINDTMVVLQRQGKVIILGTAKQAGYTDCQSHAPIYGLPGMTLQNVAEKKTDKPAGVKALPRTPGPERELKRNPFELRDLALLTRT